MYRCVFVLLLILSWNTSTWAGCPTCTNPNLPSMDGGGQNSVLTTNRIRARVALRGSTARSIHESTDALSASGAGDNQGRSERAWDYLMMATTIDLEHAATSHFGWALTLPVRYMSVTEDESHVSGASSSGAHAHPATHFGLGDLSIYGTVYGRASVNSSWWFNGRVGFTIPTGNILEDPNQAAVGSHSHEHIFFGSGTVDPRALLTIGYHFTDWTVRTSGHLRAVLYENVHGYRGGTQAGGGVAALSSFGLAQWRFGLRVEGFYAGAAQWADSGVSDLFSGKSGYLAGIEAIYWTGDWDVSVGVDTPFITSTVDGRFTVPAIIKTGLGCEF